MWRIVAHFGVWHRAHESVPMFFTFHGWRALRFVLQLHPHFLPTDPFTEASLVGIDRKAEGLEC